MSSNYKINFKQLRQEGLKETFAAFERAMNALQVDFYLIGALARDTWFAQKGIRALGTKDIDLAIFVSDDQKYEELKNYLVKEEGFTPSTSNEYVLFDTKGQQVDLLPFGLIEIEGKKIIDSEGMVHTNVSGFKEVYDKAVEEVVFEDEFTFKVSTLAGIIILKLVAFEDRPEMRTKDIQDIGTIITNYFEMESELIYDKHSDLFTENTGAMSEVSARAIGREMLPILNRNPILKERILSILHDHIKNYSTSSLTKILTGLLDFSPNTIEDTVGILTAIISGIHDTGNINSIEREDLAPQEMVKHFDITKGYFTLTSEHPVYPSHPFSIFSKNAKTIRIIGRSTYPVNVSFTKSNGQQHKQSIISRIGTPFIIEETMAVQLEESFLNFEIEVEKNPYPKKFCVLFFELLE